MLKKQNGVTLVALVITIIVLLILAGVTLAMVVGDNGIFSKANEASSKTTQASVKDAVGMGLLEIQTDSYTETNNYSSSFKYEDLEDDTKNKSFVDSLENSGFKKVTTLTDDKYGEYTISLETATGEGTDADTPKNIVLTFSANAKNKEYKITINGSTGALTEATWNQ